MIFLKKTKGSLNVPFRYVAFLKDFLETAEKHYMVGYKVDYYIFTDRPGDIPNVTLAEGRRVSVSRT